MYCRNSILSLLNAASIYQGLLASDLDNTFDNENAQYKLLLHATGIAGKHHDTAVNQIVHFGLVTAENIEQATDVCAWHAVECTDRAVTKISWHLGDPVEVHALGSFPPTVRTLYLYAKDIEGDLPSRQLPRELRALNLFNNKLTGFLDIPSLPRKIELVIVGYNRFSGPFVLDGLPENLRMLDITSSYVQTIHVVNAALPKDLEFVYYGWPYQLKIKVLCFDEKKADARVRVPDWDVHTRFVEEGIDFEPEAEMINLIDRMR